MSGSHQASPRQVYGPPPASEPVRTRQYPSIPVKNPSKRPKLVNPDRLRGAEALLFRFSVQGVSGTHRASPRQVYGPPPASEPVRTRQYPSKTRQNGDAKVVNPYDRKSRCRGFQAPKPKLTRKPTSRRVTYLDLSPNPPGPCTACLILCGRFSRSRFSTIFH